MSLKMWRLIVATIFIVGSLIIVIYAPFPLFKVTEIPSSLPENSAIEKAHGQKYYAKELNLFSCLSIPEKTCDSFFNRFYASQTGTTHMRARTETALMKALGRARQKEIFVFATNHFEVGHGYVFIDAKAEDEKIVNFLLKNGEMRQ